MTIEQRFQRLESQNAKMKAAVAGMAVVLAVVLLVGAGQERRFWWLLGGCAGAC